MEKLIKKLLLIYASVFIACLIMLLWASFQLTLALFIALVLGETITHTADYYYAKYRVIITEKRENDSNDPLILAWSSKVDVANYNRLTVFKFEFDGKQFISEFKWNKWTRPRLITEL